MPSWLVWDKFPSYMPFMLGVAAALLANYGPSAKLHKQLINLHAGPALMMCSTLMGATGPGGGGRRPRAFPGSCIVPSPP